MPGPGPLTSEPQLKARAPVPGLSEGQPASSLSGLEASSYRAKVSTLHGAAPHSAFRLELGSLLRWSVTVRLG